MAKIEKTKQQIIAENEKISDQILKDLRSKGGDNMSLPDRFSSLIIDRAKYYVYMLRSDPQHAQLADRDYQRKLRLFKTDYSTKADYMRSDVRIYNVMSDR